MKEKQKTKLSFWYNRKLAVPIAVVVCLLSLVMGAGGSLRAERSHVQQSFFTGDAAVQPYLLTYAAEAANLCVVASRVLDAEDGALVAVREAREQLLAAVDGGDAHLMYVLSTELRARVDMLYSDMEKQGMGDKDSKDALNRKAEFDRCDMPINLGRDAYNKKVAEFNGRLETFPAEQFAALAGVSRLRLFA